MFLSTPSIRPFVQNENTDNSGFKKPGTLKTSNLNQRTPFKDRSVNSTASFVKNNFKKEQNESFTNKLGTKNEISKNLEMTFKEDIYINDYAFSKETPDEFVDIFPTKTLDVYKLLNSYLSQPSPEYVCDYFDEENLDLLPEPNIEPRWSPLPSPVRITHPQIPEFNM